MHLNTKARLITFNISIFCFVFFLVLFIVFQGILTYMISHERSQLIDIGRNAVLHIEENLKSSVDPIDFENTFQKRANLLGQDVSHINQVQTKVYSKDGLELFNSAPLYTTQLWKELSLATETNQPYFTYAPQNGQNILKYLTPITIDETLIGYIGFIYPLTIVDTLLFYFVILYILGCVLSFPLLIYLTLTLSHHVIRPIEELTKISKVINEGNYDVHITYRKQDEIGELTSNFNEMVSNTNNLIHQLNSERNRLASVLASIDDGLLAMDKDGNIITSNSYIKTYFNVANPKTIYDFQFQSFLRDIFDDLKNGKHHISSEIDCNDRNLLIIGSPIQKADLEENYMIIIRNITSTRQLQNEQRKFISSVSHELRTPLTTIIGYTDMLTRRQVEDTAILNRSLMTINREGHRLLRLVDDMLNINFLEKTEFDFKKTNVDLHALLCEVVEQMQIKSQENNINIIYKSEEILSDIFGDYDRLSQLFINILHNAIKYSNKGDIIDVVSTLESNHIVVSIRDYGVGISELEQNKIFSAFYRVEEDRARSEGEGGSGLGLYLAKQIVDKHQGSISIESIVGEGTIVIINFPIISSVLEDNNFE